MIDWLSLDMMMMMMMMMMMDGGQLLFGMHKTIVGFLCEHVMQQATKTLLLWDISNTYHANTIQISARSNLKS